MLPKLKVLLKALTNIFLTRLFFLFGKYRYPLVIIPKVNYCEQIDFSLIPISLEIFLIRKSNFSTITETFTKLGTLKEEAILAKDLTGMSMSMLGGDLKIDHIKFRQLKKGAENWNGGMVYFIDYKNDFVESTEVIPIFFSLKQIHNISFPYYRDDKEARQLIAALKLPVKTKENKFQLDGSYVVRHVPINLNYWHVELTLRDAQNKEIRRLEKTWAKSASLQILGQIVSVAFKETPSISQIPESMFLRTA